MRIALAALVAFGAAFGGSSSARAEELGISLTYRVPARCPLEQAFRAQVESRLPAAGVRRGIGATAIVSVLHSGGQFVGTLAVRTDDGAHRVRDVAGRDCDQVVAALALVAALMLREQGAAVALPEAQLSTLQLPPAAPGPPAVRPAPVVGGVRAGVDAAGDATWRWAAVGGVSGVRGVVPGTGLAAIAGLAAERRSRRGHRFGLRLSLLRAGGTTAVAQATAQFSWSAAEGELCPVVVRARRKLSLQGCATAMIGRLSSVSEDLANSAAVQRLWGAVGASTRIRWQLTGWLSAELALATALPLRRDRYFVDADRTVHRIAPVVFHGGVRLGVHFE